ncbi:phosphoadenosine phosphosulfate reductase [Paracoccus zeaxanthinifaciens]|uniref:phosphoadenosine phosphosulfate reductase n=1 Tax=Paracoccus zeaxanthinifaciens TaxID=187400 RepID=UPI0012EBA14B|nr:phosphoadenosine phosphosulfate reductase [Paracoccus zeaxanthinifaciens]
MSKLTLTTQTSSPGEAALIEKGAREGFYRELGPKHSVLFSQRGGTLLVTFENLDHVVSRTEDQLPWGYSLAEKNNWSILGLMAREWSWYRDECVLNFFDELRASGFFKDFERVIFYGASMGAYAACAFSSASPGADVIAISPQATLDRGIASWETRYRKAWRRNFSNRYGFAPDEVRTANQVILVFDPASQLDAMHAALFRGDNITHISCRFMGHRIMSLWGTMGVLKEAASCLLKPEPDIVEFRQLMRKRYASPRYQKELLAQVTTRRRDDLIVRLCMAVLSRRGAPHFRHALRDARSRLAVKRK